MTPTTRNLSFYALAIGTFLLDQFSKLAIVMALALGHSRPLVDGVLYLTHVHNMGAAFSLFDGHVAPLSFISLTAAVALIVYQHRRRPDQPMLLAGLALVLGGTAGNGFDRLALGYVRDMIGLAWHGQPVFPVFNLADSAIFIGVALLGWHHLRTPEPAVIRVKD